MNKAVPWSIKGVDFDAREAAKEAARRSGLSLGEWLNSVIAEQATELGVEPAEIDADTRLEAVAARLTRLTHGQAGAPKTEPIRSLRDKIVASRRTDAARAPQPAEARPRPYDGDDDEEAAASFIRETSFRDASSRHTRSEPEARPREPEDYRERNYRDPEALLNDAVERFERRTREAQKQAASALTNVAQWIEVSEGRRDIERETINKVSQRLEEIQHQVVSGAGKRDYESRAALDKVARRLAEIESHVATRSEDDAQQPVRQAIARLETRFDAFARRPVHAPAVESTLRDLDGKIESLHKRLERSQAERPASEHLARLEAKIGELTEGLNRPAAQEPRGRLGRPSVQEAVADIARRQRDLDGARADSAAERAQAAPALAEIKGDIAALAGQLDALRRDGAARAEAKPASDPQLAQLHGEIVAAKPALAGIKHDISDLAARLDGLRQDAAKRGVAGPDPQVAQLRGEIAALSQAVGNLAPRGAVAALEISMRDLARRIEASRDAGARENLIGPIEQLAGELQSAMRQLDPRPTIDVLRREIQAIHQRIEAASGGGLDRDALQQINAQMQEMRDLLKATQAQPLPVANIERQIAALSQRIDRVTAPQLVAVPAAPIKPDLSGIADDIRGMVSMALPKSAFGAIEQRLAALDGKIEEALAQAGGHPHLAGLSQQMSEMQRRLAVPQQAGAVDMRPFEALVQDLSRKLEAGRSNKEEPQALQALDDKLSDIAAHLQRSDRDLSSLAHSVHSVEDKISAQMSAPSAAGTAHFAALESLLGQMAEKMQAAQAPGASATDALQALETQLQRIAERLERSDKGLSALSTSTAAHFDTLSRRIDNVQVAVAHQLETVRQTQASLPQADVLAIEEMVRQLAGRIDAVRAPHPSEAAIVALESQVARIAERLEQHPPKAAAGPDLAALENLVLGLAHKIEAAAGPHASSAAIAALETQVARMSEQLEFSDRGVPALNALERSVTELFAHVEESRQSAVEAAELAAHAAAREAVKASGALPPDQIAREIDTLRSLQDEADRRTHSTLTAVHETLEQVVDRLDHLENAKPAAAPAAAPAASNNPFAQTRAALAAAVGRKENAPARTPMAEPAKPVEALSAIEADEDFLIEPGKGGIRALRASAEMRAAPEAEEAAAPAKPAAGGAQKSFIEAARRAAQAAAIESIGEAKPMAPQRVKIASGRSPMGVGFVSRAGDYFQNRGKPVLLGLAALVLIFGTVAAVKLMDRSPREAANIVEGAAEAAKNANPAPEAAQAAAPAPNPPAAPAEAKPGAGAPPAAKDKSASLEQADPNPVGAIPSPPRSLSPNLGAVPARALSEAALGKPPAALTSPGSEQSVLRLAESGNAAAQFEAGMRIVDGRTTPRDYKQAAAWFEKAAAQDLAPAQYHLGSLYEKGVGVTRDLAKAKVWYKLAAERGNARAMHNLAVLTADAGGDKPDYASAVVWFAKAAEYGVRDSQYNLAVLYAKGLGVSQNLVSSYAWFTIAANQGDEDAGKKRIDVGAKLDSRQLTAAQAQVENFHPLPLLPAANEVKPPPGGWDGGAQRRDAVNPAEKASPAAPAFPSIRNFGRPNVSAL